MTLLTRLKDQTLKGTLKGLAPVTGRVVWVCQKVGGRVDKYETLVEIDNLEGGLEITSEATGVLTSLGVQVGSLVVVGSPLYWVTPDPPSVPRLLPVSVVPTRPHFDEVKRAVQTLNQPIVRVNSHVRPLNLEIIPPAVRLPPCRSLVLPVTPKQSGTRTYSVYKPIEQGIKGLTETLNQSLDDPTNESELTQAGQYLLLSLGVETLTDWLRDFRYVKTQLTNPPT